MTRHYILAGLVLAMCVAALIAPPIPQDPTYHQFADDRAVLGIANGWNVLSNIAIGLGGVFGLAVMSGRTRTSEAGATTARRAYVTMFAAVILTAVGSAYYHSAPDNARLVWDRLPLTLGFMALLTAVLAERVSARLAATLFVPLLAFGAGSVVYWSWTETAGAGDLRWYALVQFGTLPTLLVLMLLYSGSGSALGTNYGLAALCAYSAAKVFELADDVIFSMGEVVSGHTLKHLAAGVGIVLFAMMVRRE